MKMHERERALAQDIKTLFDKQRLAVLATCPPEGQPHTSLIAFAASEDLRSVVFATPKTTRKFTNLLAEPRVSLLVDDRSNQAEDFHQAIAVTVSGSAEALNKTRSKKLLHLYLEKHPYLKNFVAAPTCAFIRVAVHRYAVVSRFQKVMELKWDPAI